MKKILCGVFLLSVSAFLILSGDSLCTNRGLRLDEQAALNLMSFPDITEGVLDLMYMRIESLWHEGRYEDVFNTIGLITRIAPGDTDSWILGGWILIYGIAPGFQGEKRKEAVDSGVAFWEEGIKHNPENAGLHSELAWFFFRQGDLEKSLKYIERAEKYDGESISVMHLKAHVLTQKGRNKEAIEAWENLKEKHPDRIGVAERFIHDLRHETQ